MTGQVTPLDEQRFDDPAYAEEQTSLEAGLRLVLDDAFNADSDLA